MSELPFDLFEYGIHTEGSHIRAHVSVVNRTIYVFRTKYGVEAVTSAPREIRFASQPGVNGPTAQGWLVPVDEITDVRRVRFLSWEGWTQYRRELTTSAKGNLAVLCVIGAMRRGRFPFWIDDASEDGRREVQQIGTDILVFCRQRVQVKCDYEGGDRPLGTGNLFLQRAERNPLRHK